MSNQHRKQVSCVVVDAFGTIAHLSRPSRPYAALRSMLSMAGAPTEDFPEIAMTRPLGLAGMAEHYGVEIPMSRLRRLEQDLFQEMQSLQLSPGACAAIARFMSKGCNVIIGSNLSMPYGVALRQALTGAGLHLNSLEESGGLRTAFSYEMGTIKPRADFYAAIEAAAGVPPSEILMVGDKALEDCNAPMRCGWQAAAAINRTGSAQCWDSLVFDCKINA